jgi:transcriptional regulator with XRE-family HTH domain
MSTKAKTRAHASPKNNLTRKRMPSTNEISEDAISTTLGLRIKALRTQRELTLEELSQRSSVSRAMLSKVERGEKSPTLPIIIRIAGGLECSLSTLLGAEPNQSGVALIRAHERLFFRDPNTGFERWVLSPAHLDNGFEFVLHRIPPGQSTGLLPPYSVPTEKYISVSEGQLTVYIDKSRHILNAGDSMYFGVNSPYCFANNDDRLACCYYMNIIRKL